MLEYGVLIIILLIILFIMYLFYFVSDKDVKLLSENTIKKISNYYNEKEYYITTDFLHVNKDVAYVIYYNLSLNCVYWTVGVYDENQNIDEVNMGKYQSPEDGDTLLIIVGNNFNVMALAKNKIKAEHNAKYPYKKLKTDYLYTNKDFYISVKAFSNMFTTHPKIKIKEMFYENVKYQEPMRKCIDNSQVHNFENINLFNKTKNGFIDDSFKKLKVIKDFKKDDIPKSCIVNKSNIFENTEFKIVAVDHFKTKVALHSNIIAYDAETDKQIRIEITGEISDRINEKNMITVRRISYKIPDNIRFIYFIEYIYYDFATGNKPLDESIIPMSVYIKN